MPRLSQPIPGDPSSTRRAWQATRADTCGISQDTPEGQRRFLLYTLLPDRAPTATPQPLERTLARAGKRQLFCLRWTHLAEADQRGEEERVPRSLHPSLLPVHYMPTHPEPAFW